MNDIRKKMENIHVKKHRTIVRNVTNLYEKIVLTCAILKVIQGNDNIHVWKCLEFSFSDFSISGLVFYLFL